jgi:hypothetical protein
MSSALLQGAVYSTALFSCAAGDGISLVFRNSKSVKTIGGLALMGGDNGSTRAFNLSRRSLTTFRKFAECCWKRR